MNASDYSSAPVSVPAKKLVQPSALNKVVDLLTNSKLQIVLLIALVAICYGKTLTSYFLADDFGEIAYVSRIFHGEPGLLWSNFTGNYMQIPGMNVYRPVLLLSLVADFLLYRTNAVGYYCTNLVFFTGNVVLLYFVCRWLTSSWTTKRSSVAALLGAALFAANPLRCESVSWVVGRVDVVCGFFYLLSLYLFLKSRRGEAARMLKAFGVLSFWLAIGTKEMAVGLPVVLFCVESFDLDSAEPHLSVPARLKRAALFSAPLWISLAVYFVIRFLCLGTLSGGYVAGFGASQTASMIQRWLDPDVVKRFCYPICAALFPQRSIYSEILTASYGVLAGAAMVRFLCQSVNYRRIAFLGIWAATAAAPIFQLWGIGWNLEGARFYFFLSMPLLVALPLILLEPNILRLKEFSARGSGDQSRWIDVIELRICSIVVIALIGATLVMARLAFLTDMNWVHAGREVKEVFTRAVNLAAGKSSSTSAAGSIVLLGIPQERAGAHQILNGETFATGMRPPFTAQASAAHFAVFGPVMFGPPEGINPGRLNRILGQKSASSFVWSGADSTFKPIQIGARSSDSVTSTDFSSVDGDGSTNRPISKPYEISSLMANQRSGTQIVPYTIGHAAYSATNGTVTLNHPQDCDAIKVTDLSLDPRKVDFLKFSYDAKGVPLHAVLKVLARGRQSSGADGCVVSVPMTNGSGNVAVVPLSRNWHWFAIGSIDSLSIAPYPCEQVSFRGVQVLSAALVSPLLTATGVTEDTAGVCDLREGANSLDVECNLRAVPNACKSRLEIGKRDFFFENFEGSNGEGVDPVQRVVDIPPSGHLKLDKSMFGKAGFYQVRARALNASGQPVGECSDSITVKI